MSILLTFTEWCIEFFTRLGFTWHEHDEDEQGNLFFFGTHVVLPGDDKVFRKILSDGGVTVDFSASSVTVMFGVGRVSTMI